MNIFTNKAKILVLTLSLSSILFASCSRSAPAKPDGQMKPSSPQSSKGASIEAMTKPPTASEIELLKQAVREKNLSYCEKIAHPVFREQCLVTVGSTQ